MEVGGKQLDLPLYATFSTSADMENINALF